MRIQKLIVFMAVLAMSIQAQAQSPVQETVAPAAKVEAPTTGKAEVVQPTPAAEATVAAPATSPAPAPVTSPVINAAPAASTTPVVAEPAKTEVKVEVKTPTPAAPVAAPAVVTPTPSVVDTKIDATKTDTYRKSRQDVEAKTEAQIVEKLEESRLIDEKGRADRLFGDRLESQTPPAQIEKVEITQPEEIEVIQSVRSTPKKKSEGQLVARDILEDEPKDESVHPYVSLILASPTYKAENVKSNYGVGVAVGGMIEPRWSLEGTFIASNYFVDTFWEYNLYREMDQYDAGLGVKYTFLEGRLKPYLGGSVNYIYRKYVERVKFGPGWMINPNEDTEETHSINLGLSGGVDFAVNTWLGLGAGVEYSKNLMNKNEFQYDAYGLPSNGKALEEIDFWTLKLLAKFSF